MIDALGFLQDFASTHPHHLAIRHDDIALTFAELDALVAATAADLAEALEPDPLPHGSFVPLFVAHDIPSVVLIHAGFRIGVPIGMIDAALPEAEMAERLSALGQFRVALVHQESCAAMVPPSIKVIVAADRPARTMDRVTVDPECDSVAFFTSGSTGRAKGVVKSRKGFNVSLLSLEQGHGSGPERGPVASIGPFHWSGGFAAPLELCNGRSMAILTFDGGQESTLIEACRTARVESLAISPSIAFRLARTNTGPPLPDLKVVELGGEPLEAAQVQALGGLIGPSASVRAVWGASESYRIFHSEVDPGDQLGGTVPIRLLVDGSIRLEPSDEDPVAIHGGTVGEILVRGDVAKRYLGQPELTDLCFGVDPDGVRFWRSGDLAEQLADGTLFLRGRIDDMVKINGKLVEPAESLAFLRAFPGVRSVQVLPHTYASGRIVLVAHIVTDDNVSPDEIRRMLLDRLPIHVIPGVIMRHDQLPLTDRGKVDRQALQKMQPVAWLESDARAAGSELETFLLGQLQAIIETDEIGVDDDIWFVGLDSLGATELVASIADIGLGELAPTVLLKQRTIRSLSLRLQEGIDERLSDLVTFNSQTPGDPFFCLPGAGGTAINFRHVAECFSTERPLVVIEAHGMHTRAKPDRTITAMANRVSAAANERQPTGTVTLLGYSAGGFVAWEAAQQLVDKGRGARVVILDSSFVPATSRFSLNNWGPAPPGMPRTRRVTRACRSWASGLKPKWRELRPGAPAANTLRYNAFRHMMTGALKRYVPAAARFPVLYVAAKDPPENRLSAENPSNLDRWKAIADNLTISSMDGDHHTMLEAPNVTNVASAITQWINSPRGSGSR